LSEVAFLGLGVMGFPMAGHLAADGHGVVVYNRTSAKASRWVDHRGGASAPTPREAAAGRDFVLACVGNDDDLRAVALGPAAPSRVKPGAIFVDHTTASAKVARELHPRPRSSVSALSTRRFRTARRAPKTGR
jgi:3-hydroxyisobutyrate dehydrogenase